MDATSGTDYICETYNSIENVRVVEKFHYLPEGLILDLGSQQIL